MTHWLDDHALAEALAKQGWHYEDIVAKALRSMGLEVLQPPKEWRTDVNDRHRFTNEVDLLLGESKLRASVKSRKVTFTCPEDIPPKFDPLFVDTVRKWEVKLPTPFAVICVSQETDAAIWLPSSTRPFWGGQQAYDRLRNYSDSFMTAPSTLWQPLATLPEAIRTAFDGCWRLTSRVATTTVEVMNGLVQSVSEQALFGSFVGQPLRHLARHMARQGSFRSVPC